MFIAPEISFLSEGDEGEGVVNAIINIQKKTGMPINDTQETPQVTGPNRGIHN
jgi:hypothetical protein